MHVDSNCKQEAFKMIRESRTIERREGRKAKEKRGDKGGEGGEEGGGIIYLGASSTLSLELTPLKRLRVTYRRRTLCHTPYTY